MIEPGTPAQELARDPQRWVSLPHVEALAESFLPRDTFDFIAAGAADELTVQWNRQAFDAIRLRPRVLRDVNVVDTAITLFGERLPSPVILAPTAYHRMLHPDGELATVAGANAAGVPWIVSTSSNTAFKEIAAAAAGPLWFQLYVQSDRGYTRELVERVQAAGCRALCLTVDTPVLGARDRQRRAMFSLPSDIPTPHLYDRNRGKREISDLARVVVTWRDVEWLRSISRVPLVLKGILDREDAEAAIGSGADAIIVSNHGGRNLDTVPATIDALPAIAEQVTDRIPLLLDGGVRRGTDVLKALAFGATAVLIGRPYCYGLALAGAAGVARVVSLLHEEMVMSAMLLGRDDVARIDREILW